MMTCSYSSLDPEICFIKVTALLRKPYVFEHHDSNGLQLLYRAKKKNFWSLSSYQAAIRPTINRRIRRGTSPTSIFYIVLLWLRRILAWGLLGSRLQHARLSCRRPQQFIRSSFYRIDCLCGVSPFFCSSPVSYWFRFHSLFGLALAQTWVSVKAFVPLSYTDMCTRWMYFW